MSFRTYGFFLFCGKKRFEGERSKSELPVDVRSPRKTERAVRARIKSFLLRQVKPKLNVTFGLGFSYFILSLAFAFLNDTPRAFSFSLMGVHLLSPSVSTAVYAAKDS